MSDSDEFSRDEDDRSFEEDAYEDREYQEPDEYIAGRDAYNRVGYGDIQAGTRGFDVQKTAYDYSLDHLGALLNSMQISDNVRTEALAIFHSMPRRIATSFNIPTLAVALSYFITSPNPIAAVKQTNNTLSGSVEYTIVDVIRYIRRLTVLRQHKMIHG